MVSQNNVRSVDASGNTIDASGNKIDASGNLMGTIACTGNACCSTSTMWEAKVQKCVKLKEGYSMIRDDGIMIIGKKKKRVS